MPELKRELIKFYFLLCKYCHLTSFIDTFIFVEIIFIQQILFNKYIIFVLTLCTWIPQIIYNIRTHSSTSMPFLIVISNSLNKIFMLVKFKN